MKIIIFGENEDSKNLYNKINLSLEELGLSEFIETQNTSDKSIKDRINFSKEPAIIVEEESIDFIDVITEGIVPSDDDIKSMIISIIGGNSSCDITQCGTGCFC